MIRQKTYPYLEPGTSRRYYIACDGDIALSHVVGTELVFGADPYAGKLTMPPNYGTQWRPASVTLEVNARLVARRDVDGTVVGPEGSLDLGWPAPAARPGQLAVRTELPPQPKERKFDQATIERIRVRNELPLLADTQPPADGSRNTHK